jgi:hypothetical protein
MEFLPIAYLKDNELWMIGGWRWLEQRPIRREFMQRERQKRAEESAQLKLPVYIGNRCIDEELVVMELV